MSRDELRTRYLAALDGDGIGLQLQRVGGAVQGAYNVAIIVADSTSAR